jgi:hypothetical protein
MAPPIVDGMDFPGLGKATVDPQSRVIRVIEVQPINSPHLTEAIWSATMLFAILSP